MKSLRVSRSQIGFGPHPQTPRGPHGIPPPSPMGVGNWFWKTLGVGDFNSNPMGFWWGFSHIFVLFRPEIFHIFTRFSEKKPHFFLLENFIVHFANKFLEQPYSYFMNYAYSQQCGGRGWFSTKNVIGTSKIKQKWVFQQNILILYSIALISSLIQNLCPYYCLAGISQPCLWYSLNKWLFSQNFSEIMLFLKIRLYFSLINNNICKMYILRLYIKQYECYPGHHFTS